MRILGKFEHSDEPESIPEGGDSCLICKSDEPDFGNLWTLKDHLPLFDLLEISDQTPVEFILRHCDSVRPFAAPEGSEVLRENFRFAADYAALKSLPDEVMDLAGDVLVGFSLSGIQPRPRRLEDVLWFGWWGFFWDWDLSVAPFYGDGVFNAALLSARATIPWRYPQDTRLTREQRKEILTQLTEVIH